MTKSDSGNVHSAMFIPAYHHLSRAQFRHKSDTLTGLLKSCNLCCHQCGVDRMSGELGCCGSDQTVRIAYAGPHFGEEPFLSGKNGAGTVFFSQCNASCCYCQNYQISQQNSGRVVSIQELSEIFLSLQAQQCHNLDLVTPTHVMPQIVQALLLANDAGFNLPVVYNTNAFDSPGLLSQLEGIVDLYLPDLKYADDKEAMLYSGLPGYVKASRSAISEMFRQVGVLELNESDVATRGIAVRHLLLPAGVSGAYSLLAWLRSLSSDIQLCLMSQYAPHYRAKEFTEIARTLTVEEYGAVLRYAEKLGFENILAQELDSAHVFAPDFNRSEPFIT